MIKLKKCIIGFLVIMNFMILNTVNAVETNLEQSKNTNLETLAIENVLLYPPFENDISEYKAEIANDIVNLNMLAIPEDEQGSVQVTGKDNLQEGDNKVLIRVTAPDGITKKEYIIIVHRRTIEEESKYLEEQKENQEKVEDIYKAIKTSTKVNVVENKPEKSNLIIGVIIVSFILVIAFIVIRKNIKKYK